MTLPLDSAGNIMAIEKGTQFRRHFHGRSGAPIIMSGEDAALRPWHEQNVQMKSERSLGGTTGDPPHTYAHAAKSSAVQAHCLQPGGRKSSRTSHRRRQTAAKLTTFMTGVRRSMKAFAILWKKLHARFSELTFDHGNRVLGSRVATHLDVPDCVSMKAGHLRQVPNSPIERSARHPNSCASHRHEAVPLPHMATPQPLLPCPRINGGIQ